MANLENTMVAGLETRYKKLAGRVWELAGPLSDEQFWTKPFPFGNSFGHLILHLTGNLNYYIGAQIAQTGYIRDRPREFTDPNPPFKDEAFKRFDNAVAMVVKTIRSQSSGEWSAKYSGVSADAKIRLDMIMQCASHMQHHIGQMIYLSYELQRRGA